MRGHWPDHRSRGRSTVPALPSIPHRRRRRAENQGGGSARGHRGVGGGRHSALKVWGPVVLNSTTRQTIFQLTVFLSPARRAPFDPILRTRFAQGAPVTVFHMSVYYARQNVSYTAVLKFLEFLKFF